MRLSDAQRAAVIAKAEELGVDPDELVALAEQDLEADGGDKADASPQRANPPDDAKAAAAAAKSDAPKDPKLKPPLYQYHLPFVSVNEVRTIWLELPAIAGGEENAAKYAARQLAAAGAASTATPSSSDGGEQT